MWPVSVFTGTGGGVVGAGDAVLAAGAELDAVRVAGAGAALDGAACDV